MGRTYYAAPKQAENDRLIHILSTEHGTVVLAMREPRAGERGYAVGVDFTVRDAVKEMLDDWGPGEPGPGWIAGERVSRARAQPGDETFEVTILAAFDFPEWDRRVLEQTKEWCEGVIVNCAESDREILAKRPEWCDVVETHSDAMTRGTEDFRVAVAKLGDVAAQRVYFDAWIEAHPEWCPECGQRTNDDGECGACVNCRMPLCIHELPDEAFAKVQHRFDTPCDRWKLKDGVTLDAEATHRRVNPGAGPLEPEVKP